MSVVEGVAGNQVSIAESMPQKMDYTAKYTVGETGFGVIKASKSQVSYSHFSTDRGYVDSILFTRSAKGEESLMNKLMNIRINDDWIDRYYWRILDRIINTICISLREGAFVIWCGRCGGSARVRCFYHGIAIAIDAGYLGLGWVFKGWIWCVGRYG